MRKIVIESGRRPGKYARRILRNIRDINLITSEKMLREKIVQLDQQLDITPRTQAQEFSLLAKQSMFLKSLYINLGFDNSIPS